MSYEHPNGFTCEDVDDALADAEKAVYFLRREISENEAEGDQYFAALSKITDAYDEWADARIDGGGNALSDEIDVINAIVEGRKLIPRAEA